MGNMQERIKVYAAWVIVGFGGFFIAYLFLKYAAGVLFPFLVGWAAALTVRTPAKKLHLKFKIHEGAARLVLAVVGVVALGALLVFGLKTLLAELSHLAFGIGKEPAELLQRVTQMMSRLPFVDVLEDGGEKLLSGIENAVSTALPRLISQIATLLPSLFLSIGVGTIAAVYFCLDLERVHGALMRFMPEKWRFHVHSAKQSALRAAFTVLRANFILMLVAFVGMLIGFLVLGLPYPLLLSGVFALFDFLPVIGVGTFLVPWGVWLLLTGSVGQGIGLLIVFGVITVARQLAEPHLIGAGYGMHPLLTLLSMYTGARFFGAVGMILAPMAALLVYGVIFSSPSDGEQEHARQYSKKKKRF
jgi:sporulation integral membrane protein YtvI